MKNVPKMELIQSATSKEDFKMEYSISALVSTSDFSIGPDHQQPTFYKIKMVSHLIKTNSGPIFATKWKENHSFFQ